ncbi:MAG TPA: hypothetical protein VFM94_05015 [Solirubrobacterales bacterium]|nr:hypothetical protein [Solirubrobacterales bacterium]
MTDRIYTPVDSMQPPGTRPPAHGIFTDTRSAQLTDRNNPVLLLGDSGDHQI